MNTDSITTIREEVEHALEWAQDTGHAFLRILKHDYEAYLDVLDDIIYYEPDPIHLITVAQQTSRCAMSGARRHTFYLRYTRSSEVNEFDFDHHELELTLEIDPSAH